MTLLQVQLRQNEIESSRSQIENALTLSQQMLAQYIGEDSGIVDVPPVAGEVLPEHPQGLYRNPESSLVLTNEYHLLQQNLKANKLQRRITVGKYLPTVAIGGGYMYDNLMDKDHPFWMGFAQFQFLYPVGGAARMTCGNRNSRYAMPRISLRTRANCLSSVCSRIGTT